MATRVKIINGPGKFDLMVSLFDVKLVTFTLEGVVPLKVIISSASTIEHLYRERWTIGGYLDASNQSFKALYDTRTRTGFTISE